MKKIVISRNNLLSIVSVLAMISSIYLVNNIFISRLGILFAIGAMGVCALMWLVYYHKCSLDFKTIIVLLIGLLFLGKIIWYNHLNTFYSSIRILGLLFFYISLSKSHMSVSTFNRHRYCFKLFYYGIIIIYFVAFTTNEIESINQIISPTFLKVLFPLSWFAINRNRKIAPIEIAICLGFHFLLGERTAVICLIIVELFSFILKRIEDKVSNFLFWAVALACVAFPFIYIWLYKQPFSQALNSFVYNKTGEFLFSGRQLLWRGIIDEVSNNIIFGLGSEVTFIMKNAISLSPHNLYLYLYVNGGVLLILLFLMFMFDIWKDIKICSNSDKTMVAGKAYYLGLMVFLVFELFLLANNIVVSLIWWITIVYISIRSKNIQRCF